MNQHEMNPSIRFDCLQVELDKAGGSWLMTAFLDVRPRIGLRLRVSDFNMIGEDFRVHCEIRPAGRTEFEEAFMFWTDGFDEWCEDCQGCASVPIVCRYVFKSLYTRFRRILLTVPLASCREERYAGEPLSSRDHLVFGRADDLPMPPKA
jgi:hypothetical protein